MSDGPTAEQSGAPAPPPAAQSLFGEKLPVATRFADLLADAGRVRGLLGPREVPRLWERHLLNCAVLGELVPQAATVCDLGSGAGLPGIVLAIRRPDLDVTLVEPLLRRTRFLDEVVAALGLANVTVRRARAEDLHGAASFDVVTARAVAPLERLARWALPLVRDRGELLAMKGSSAADELVGARSVLRRLGGRNAEVLTVGAGLLEQPVTVVRVVKQTR